MSDCHVCTDGNAGMFGDWQDDDVGPERDDTDYNAGLSHGDESASPTAR